MATDAVPFKSRRRSHRITTETPILSSTRLSLPSFYTPRKTTHTDRHTSDTHTTQNVIGSMRAAPAAAAPTGRGARMRSAAWPCAASSRPQFGRRLRLPARCQAPGEAAALVEQQAASTSSISSSSTASTATMLPSSSSSSTSSSIPPLREHVALSSNGNGNSSNGNSSSNGHGAVVVRKSGGGPKTNAALLTRHACAQCLAAGRSSLDLPATPSPASLIPSF